MKRRGKMLRPWAPATMARSAVRLVPCPGCPFSAHEAGLELAASLDRRQEIADSMTVDDRSFVCHEEAHGVTPTGLSGPRQCAGAAVVLQRMGAPNRIMRVADHFGHAPLRDPGPGVVPWSTMAEWVRLKVGE